MVIFAVDKRDIHGLARQFLGGRQATEAAADDYNLWSFHFTAHMSSPKQSACVYAKILCLLLPMRFFLNFTGTCFILLGHFHEGIKEKDKHAQNSAARGRISKEALAADL